MTFKLLSHLRCWKQSKILPLYRKKKKKILSQYPEWNSGQYKRIHQFSTNGLLSGLGACEDDTTVTQQGVLTVQSHHTTVPCECLRTVLSKSSSFTFMAFEGDTRSLLSFYLCFLFVSVMCETPITSFWNS